MFNSKKTWEQSGKNVSLTLLKMLTKYDTFLLIYIFKTNLSKKKF